MAVAEVRTQIYLQRSQYRALKRVAAQRAVSLAQVVREAITEYLGEDGPSDRPEKGLDPVWSLLDQAAEIGGSGDAHGSHRVEEDLYGSVDL